MTSDLTASLDRLPRGATSITDLSEWIEDAVERAWVYGSLMFGDTQVRTGYLIVGMLKTTRLKGALLSISKQFDRIKIEDLTDNFAKLLAGSPEHGQRASDGSGDAGRRPARRAARSRRRRWASRRRSSASRSTSPSARARARSIRSSAATRRSARSSTS